MGLRSSNFLGSPVSVSNGGSALQGDAIFPALLERLAAAPAGGPAPAFDVSQIPDLVPALAAALRRFAAMDAATLQACSARARGWRPT